MCLCLFVCFSLGILESLHYYLGIKYNVFLIFMRLLPPSLKSHNDTNNNNDENNNDNDNNNLLSSKSITICHENASLKRSDKHIHRPFRSSPSNNVRSECILNAFWITFAQLTCSSSWRSNNTGLGQPKDRSQFLYYSCVLSFLSSFLFWSVHLTVVGESSLWNRFRMFLISYG